MLLPSDVARLVLGYLQEEGLSITSQTFIQESPNLKEYAEHTTTDGTIPACVFSVFGKGLTTILNEYMAAKAKETCHEVPAMMTSLWKKLDFTLNQIKSLQNSPAISAYQRTRSRVGVANMARQRSLTLAPAGSAVSSSAPETVSIISPMQTSHSLLSHSTPVSCTAPHSRPAPNGSIHLQIQEGGRLQTMSRESPVQIIVSEHRLNPGPLSPGRRKWDTPKKRCRALSGSGGTGKSVMTVSGLTAEPQPEEVIEENFPQLVIQNARDKILGDRSLQEKLAENINKILANEPNPQTKTSLSAMEPDQSIDEILGLQGEIHMSDDAIHDILEQTESDPAFQALFDLFDNNKNKFTEPEDGVITSISEESDDAGPSCTDRPPQNPDTGQTHKTADSFDTTLLAGKMRAGQERKTRKPAAPSNLKKVFICPSGRTSRIENSTAKLLVTHEEYQGVSSTAVAAKTKEAGSLCTTSVELTPVQIELLNTPTFLPENTTAQEVLESVTKDNTPVSSAHNESINTSFTTVAPQITMASNVDNIQQSKRAQGAEGQLVSAPSSALTDQARLNSSIPFELKKAQTLTLDLAHVTGSDTSSGGVTQSVANLSMAPAESTPPTSASTEDEVSVMPTSVSSPAAASLLTSVKSTASTSPGLTATPASSAPSSATSASTCATLTAAPEPLTNNHSAQDNSAGDSSSGVVSLKIIISDNQDEQSCGDPVLNQAVSSASGNKIPTIYLNSPIKSPGVPATPKAKLDEPAQAVSNVHCSEALQPGASEMNSTIKKSIVSSPFAGSPAQPSYIIQVPLDTNNPAFQGTTASYFLVTEPLTSDTPTKQVLVPTGISKGQPLLTSHCGVTTPPRSQCSSTALILQSPVQPLMLPVSVMGKNTLGNVQMVSNTLVAMPNPAPIQQSKPVKTKPHTVADKQSSSGLTKTTEQNLSSKVGHSLSPEDSGQQNVPKGQSSTRRILCFEPSEMVQPLTTESERTTINKHPAENSTAPSAQKTEKNNSQLVPRPKPAILGGNKPKRRITTVRCSENSQSSLEEVKETEKIIPPPQNQNDPTEKSPHKQGPNDHYQEFQSESGSSDGASQSESSKKTQSTTIQSKCLNRENSNEKDGGKSKVNDSRRPGPLSSDSVQKSGSQKEKEDSGKESNEGWIEKRNLSQLLPNVTANKENEMKGSMQAQQQQSVPSSVPRDLSPAAVTLTTSNLHLKSTKDHSKTSSLAKQAAEMLQDIQGLNSPSTPVTRPGVGSSEQTLPRTPVTGSNQESVDCPGTPATQRKGKPREGTPKHLILPNTPDVSSCSPASEAGSENSINMAAHTLMILSRAAIARTATPLKDSLRQEGAGKKTLTATKSSRKRKLSCPTDSPPAKKESKRSPSSKKKDKERRKAFDCFPLDLDVDKFLSSLHYDE